MDKELLPCPRCWGTNAHIECVPLSDDTELGYMGECGDCGSTSRLVAHDWKEATKEWNTRAPNPRIERLVEAAKNMLYMFEQVIPQDLISEFNQNTEYLTGNTLEIVRNELRTALGDLKATDGD